MINFHYSSDELASARGKYTDQDPRGGGGVEEGGEGDSSSILLISPIWQHQVYLKWDCDVTWPTVIGSYLCLHIQDSGSPVIKP